MYKYHVNIFNVKNATDIIIQDYEILVFIKTVYCLTSVEQHQTATYIFVALERCCSSEVNFNGQCHCAGEIVLPVERGSR